MLRTLLILVVAVFAGYSLGFRDAQRHRQPVLSRLAERAEGRVHGLDTREPPRTDVDDRR